MVRNISAFAVLAMTAGLVRADAPLWINRPEAEPWLPALAAAADRTGLPAPLIAELIGIESGFQPAAKNPTSSAYGCGQQITGNQTMRDYGLDRRDCAQSILGAALQLRAALDRTGSLERAVASYGTTVGVKPARRRAILARLRSAADWPLPAAPTDVAKAALPVRRAG
jgi:soluble lytic murein transglycosylase-like protein